MQIQSKKIVIKVSGNPVAQGRPRFSRRGGFVKAYDPKKSADAKANFRLAADLKVQEMNWDMLGPEVPVHVKINFYMPIPKSMPTWKKKAAEEGIIAPVTKPDLVDNGAKLCLDSLSGIVFCDDRQVTDIVCHKRYVQGVDDITGEKITGPCTIVEVELLYLNIGEIKQELIARGKVNRRACNQKGGIE